MVREIDKYLVKELRKYINQFKLEKSNSEKIKGIIFKLDGVGPVDNRPSTVKLHHFVRKRKEKKKKIVTRDT